MFFKTKDRLFPHEFRELDGDEWKFTVSNESIHLDDFCKKNLNSWSIQWKEYDKDSSSEGD